jgi:hypothetical protein
MLAVLKRYPCRAKSFIVPIGTVGVIGNVSRLLPRPVFGEAFDGPPSVECHDLVVRRFLPGDGVDLPLLSSLARLPAVVGLLAFDELPKYGESCEEQDVIAIEPAPAIAVGVLGLGVADVNEVVAL